MNIAILEDEYPILKGIETYLNSRGHIVFPFGNGDEMELFLTSDPVVDLFILDINVPGLNGLELLEQIRAIYPVVSIIMISADLSIETIEKAYLLGCSDYLKKPFHIKELNLKIEQISHKDRVICLNEIYSYDTYSKLLFKENNIIKLTKKEMQLLELLVVNKGKLVGFELIEQRFWNDEPLTSDALRSLMKRLRHKIEDSTMIETINGLGYRLK